MRLIGGFIVILFILCTSTLIYQFFIRDCSPSQQLIYTIPASRPARGDSYVHPQILQEPVQYNFSLSDLHRQYAFSTDSPQDILVFLHIQKTGGTTFNRVLISELDVRNPCRCDESHTWSVKNPCPCYSSDGKRQWLFSRYSTGWVCGLHADYTEWNECLQSGKADEIEGFHRQRRFLFVTFLREPRERYISEYLHVNRGATWSSSTFSCNGRSPTIKELPYCYTGDTWEHVLLPEFLNCSYNPANDRMTRMLANLSLVNCYETDNYDDPTRQQIILESAKENLAAMPFFGLREYANESQYLFEHTFNINFKTSVGQYRQGHPHGSREYYDNLKDEIKEQIKKRVGLDLKLYEYARQLLLARYERVVRLKTKLRNTTNSN